MNLFLASKLQGTLTAVRSRFPKPLEECHVICIPTAANVYAPEKRAWLTEEMDVVRAAGANLDVYDIEGKSAAEVAEKLEAADIIYVTGGNAYSLLEHMQKCHFKAALNAFLKRGGIYIGASAGAVVTCPRIDFIGDMDNPALANPTSYQGMSLVPFLLMVHTDHPKYGSMAMELLQKIDPSENAIALTDSQALWITNNVTELIQA